MLEKVLPHPMLKAKPNLESRIKTLKRDWAIIYDMLSGKDNSDFGWDEHGQVVVTIDAMWNSYISPVNLDITISLTMTNLLPYMQKIEPLRNMLKQLQILLKK
ncbi:hypothetical protein Golax_001207 [Gossypium laxum]|uniref:Myb/SANT-like domain-containing protein n=1 Tax=Gossypium laxum TaxID=34288 RepID=A0A7J9AWC3_9ROSI|nr:hypothetical protein [Gossypium laxum]